MRLRKMIGLTALTITLLIVVAVCLKVDDWGRDWTENSATATFEIADASVSHVAEQVEHWAEQNRLWAIQEQAPVDDGIQLRLTRSTRVFRFTDDVLLFLKPSASGVSIQASSQSRLGKGDLGQNPRNLAEIQNAWQ